MAGIVALGLQRNIHSVGWNRFQGDMDATSEPGSARRSARSRTSPPGYLPTTMSRISRLGKDDTTPMGLLDGNILYLLAGRYRLSRAIDQTERVS